MTAQGLQAKQQRWMRAQALIERWWSPFADQGRVTPDSISEAEARLGSPLPLALQEWYQLVGDRPDLYDGSVRILPPADLAFSGQQLVVAVTQSLGVWGIRWQHLGLPDPPVLYWDPEHDCERPRRRPPPGWAKAGRLVATEMHDGCTYSWYSAYETLSALLLDKLLDGTLFVGPFRAVGRTDRRLGDAIAQHYECWQQIDGAFADLYGDRHTVISCQDDDHGMYVRMIGWHRASMERFLCVTDHPGLRVTHRLPGEIHRYSDACIDVVKHRAV